MFVQFPFQMRRLPQTFFGLFFCRFFFKNNGVHFDHFFDYSTHQPLHATCDATSRHLPCHMLHLHQTSDHCFQSSLWSVCLIKQLLSVSWSCAWPCPMLFVCVPQFSCMILVISGLPWLAAALFTVNKYSALASASARFTWHF